MTVKDDSEELPGLPLVPVGSAPDVGAGRDVEVVGRKVDGDLDDDTAVLAVALDVVDHGHVVDVVHTDDVRALLEVQLVAEELVNVVDVAPAGLGENAADSIVEACKAGPFTSKADFKARTKVSSTIADDMADLGILGNIPESDQISIFDMMGQM